MATATLTPQQNAETLLKNARQNQRATQRRPTDDEILGLVPERAGEKDAGQLDFNWSEDPRAADAKTSDPLETAAKAEQDLQTALESNPQLKSAWQDAAEYRKTFATPEEARNANTRLADLDKLDALFFSKRTEDHAELARAVAALDPGSFNSLASAMAQLASSRTNDNGPSQPANHTQEARSLSVQANTGPAVEQSATDNLNPPGAARGLTQAQTDFFHGANAAAVEQVLHSIEAQVGKLLPEEISKSARNRVVGEIYRELDSTLRSNRQLAQQMRDAFRSGALDAEHQRAIVSLVAGRARQALPAVAKRVLNEWTSTIVAANQDRRARQRTAERRIDIAGSGRAGTAGRQLTSPRDIDYARMSDADILNL